MASDDPPILEPDWYRLKYNLIAAHVNEAAKRKDPSLAAVAIAHGRTALLHSQAALVPQRAMLWWRSRSPSPHLERFLLETFEPAAWVALAVAAVLRTPEVAEATDAGTPHEQRERLLRIFAENPARDAPPVDKLVAYAVAIADRSARARYNLACLRAVTGKKAQAETEFRACLQATTATQRPRLLMQAKNDPTLEAIRGSLDGILKSLKSDEHAGDTRARRRRRTAP
jgi:hypothetical protein